MSANINRRRSATGKSAAERAAINDIEKKLGIVKRKWESDSPSFKGSKHPAYGTIARFHHKKFTPKQFKKKVEEYFIENDRKYYERLTYQGQLAKGYMKIPYSLPALANYLRVSGHTLKRYRLDENYQPYWETMRWAVSMIEERVIEGMLMGHYNNNASEFILKNLKSDPEHYADKIEYEKRSANYTKVDVHVVNDKADLEKLKAESEKNKRELGINLDEIKKLEEGRDMKNITDTINIKAKEVADGA